MSDETKESRTLAPDTKGKPKAKSKRKRKKPSPALSATSASAPEKPATAQVLKCWSKFQRSCAKCSTFFIGLSAIFAAAIYVFGNGVQEMNLEAAPALKVIGVPEEQVEPIQRTLVHNFVNLLTLTYDMAKLSLGLFIDVGNPIDISALKEEEEQVEALRRKEQKTMEHRADQMESQGSGPYGIYYMLERRNSKLATTLVHRWDQAAWAFD